VRRTRNVLLAVATMATLVVLAVPSQAATGRPRWVLHVQRFAGGISSGVRAMASPEAAAAQARHLRASGAAAAPALHNVQMNDDSNPPLPQNETSVAYSTQNQLIAVAGATTT
jgi:hypothetical protein